MNKGDKFLAKVQDGTPMQSVSLMPRSSTGGYFLKGANYQRNLDKKSKFKHSLISSTGPIVEESKETHSFDNDSKMKPVEANQQKLVQF